MVMREKLLTKCYSEKRHRGRFSIAEVKARFEKLEQASGPVAKTTLLTTWLTELDAARGELCDQNIDR